MDAAHPAQRMLRAWAGAGTRFSVSAVAWAEFRCGPVTPPMLDAWLQVLGGQIVAMDQAIAERAADLFNLTGRRSRSLPDCLIAATAIAHGAPLATFNPADFEPMVKHGLILRL